MKPIAKILASVAVGFVLLLCAALGDARIRRMQVSELAIVGLPIEGAEVSGAHSPDFLWVGRAWWIEIDTTKPLLLTLDDWCGRIPVGVHKVFSNHDHTNTGQYGDKDFWGFPKSVSVREAPP